MDPAETTTAPMLTMTETHTVSEYRLLQGILTHPVYINYYPTSSHKMGQNGI